MVPHHPFEHGPATASNATSPSRSSALGPAPATSEAVVMSAAEASAADLIARSHKIR